MFSFRLKDFSVMMLKTLLLIFILDFLSTAFIPTFQQTYLFPSFHLLFIIYLSFYQPADRLPFLVLIIQCFHSIFTVEGWALGTITGCLVSYLLILIRDTIQFSSFWATFLLVYGIQVVWSILNGSLLSLKVGQWYPLQSYFTFSLTQGIILGLIALPTFKVLENIWSKDESSSLAADRMI